MLLAQLQQAVIGLLATVNAALTTAGLPPLTSLADPPTGGTQPLRAPYGLVVIDAAETRPVTMGGPAVWAVAVVIELQVAGGEAAALRYGETVGRTVAAARSTVAAAVTGGSLLEWRLSGLETDEGERANTKDRSVRVGLVARLV